MLKENHSVHLFLFFLETEFNEQELFNICPLQLINFSFWGNGGLKCKLMLQTNLF